MWIEISSHNYFQDPLMAKAFKKDAGKYAAQFSKLEQAYSFINQGLSLYFQEVSLAS